jgi:NAD+ kinase
VLVVEVIPPSAGVLWCDGRRSIQVPPGARVEVRRSDLPVRLARLARPPFTDRLVAKFGLPVHGWRGRAQRTDS